MSDRPGLPGPNGGDLLVALMDAAGVDTAYGVVSVHNLPLVDAVATHRRFVPVRHEAAAVNAADAESRVTGGLGIAITSTGTGAGNAAGSMIEALSAGSRVLHVTGQIDTPYLGQGRGFIHETPDQFAMLSAVSKAAYSVDSAATAGDVLARAVRDALTPPQGPISVEWPIDLQYAECPVGALDLTPGAAPTVDPDDLHHAAKLLGAARRPVVWAGGGAVLAGPQLEALLDRLRAGLLTSNAGRGAVAEDHGACVGNFGTSQAGRALLAEADLLVTVGSHLRSNETGDYSLPLPTSHVQIDVDPAAIGRVHPADVGLVGDAAAILGALLQVLPERTATEADWLVRVAAARRDARHALRESIGWNAEVCDTVRKLLPRDAVIARDVTIASSSWGNRLLMMDRPSVNVFPRGGGIGQGLAMAVGASVARPDRPTLALVGDGGLAVHLGELLTVAQERPWLVVLVFDDGGYGVLRNTQDAFVGRRTGVDLTSPDFVALAASMDIPSWSVSSAFELEQAFSEAVAVRGPALVRVDVPAMGDLPRPFTPPVSIPGRD